MFEALMEMLERHTEQHLDLVALSARSYWGDVPDGVIPAEFHQANKRKCVTCREEFFGSKQRIECRSCTGAPMYEEVSDD